MIERIKIQYRHSHIQYRIIKYSCLKTNLVRKPHFFATNILLFLFRDLFSRETHNSQKIQKVSTKGCVCESECVSTIRDNKGEKKRKTNLKEEKTEIRKRQRKKPSRVGQHLFFHLISN